MPPKVQQLKAALANAGFSWRPGKGSHTVWTYPFVPELEVTQYQVRMDMTRNPTRNEMFETL